MSDLKIVCWKWKPTAGYRSQFTSEHVNVLRRMVKRHFHAPHTFVCITDDQHGLDREVESIKLWDDLVHVVSPHGPYNPSCYRRLRAFAPEAAQLIGPRFVSLDLDVVIVRDVTPLWDRNDEFVIWGDSSRTTPYNGSMWMLEAGKRTKAWTEFHPEKSPALARAKGYHGSDQAWLSYILPNEKRWQREDGVLSFRVHIKPMGYKLPTDARIVFFNGHIDPWTPVARRNCPWISQHYQ